VLFTALTLPSYSLGKIIAAAGNIVTFLHHGLEVLPHFLQSLSPERKQDFFTLLNRSTQTSRHFNLTQTIALEKLIRYYAIIKPNS